jgi:uncharacterized protein (TIGR00251 family)
MIAMKESGGSVSFAVKVQPRAKRNAITGALGDALKLSLTAPPLEGRANHAVIEFFADLFEIPRSQVTITSGETSRNKLIRLTGVSAQQVREKLAAAGLT